jgi:hypothetical protein
VKRGGRALYSLKDNPNNNERLHKSNEEGFIGQKRALSRGPRIGTLDIDLV